MTVTAASDLPRIALTTGEPAGIGPDLALRVAAAGDALPARIVAVGDRDMLEARADAIGVTVALVDGDGDGGRPAPGTLEVIHRRCPAPVSPGELNPANSGYVLACIDAAVDGCLAGAFDAMVTAPVNKAVIADAGHAFMGHTEWIAERCGAQTPVMMLVSGGDGDGDGGGDGGGDGDGDGGGPSDSSAHQNPMRVCLLTTHLPLAAVPRAVTRARILAVLAVMRADLRRWFGVAHPRIGVCGLNPHAGEAGLLGREEIDIIGPAIAEARAADRHSDIIGPLPADTAFTPARLAGIDALLAMYHDQGLPAFKRAAFGGGVNLTLGLPIIRASVDHGSALELAGRPVGSPGAADASSLRAAVALAARLARRDS